MPYDMRLVGRRIQSARKAKRYTQEYVAAKVNIGVKFLSQIECGKAGMSVQTLLALCEMLEVSPNYILLFPPDSNDNLLTGKLAGLSPQQIQDAETLLTVFVRNCKRI